MNYYEYTDIQEGQQESFSFTITDQMMQQVRMICGDNNPLHCDETYAIQHGYKGRVAYGMLTSLFYSTLAGVYLPGEKSLIHSIECKFHLPVYIGDQLKVVGVVDKKYDKFQLIKVKASIFRNEDELVSSAVIQIGVRSDGEEKMV